MSATDPTPETTSASPTTVSGTNADVVSATLETENFIDTYQIIAEWIRFADTKATVVLTVAGAISGLLIPTLKPFLDRDPTEHLTSWWPAVTLLLFFGWLITTGISSVSAFLCVHPFRQQGKHPSLGKCNHFHAAAISSAYSIDDVDQFVQDCDKIGTDGLKQEIITAILLDSHISSHKYIRVTRAIRQLALSAVFAVLYTLAIQF